MTGMIEFLLDKVAGEGSRRARIAAMLDHVCCRWAGDVLVLGGEASMPARLHRPAGAWGRLVHMEPARGKRYALCIAGSADCGRLRDAHHFVDGPIVILSSPNIIETVSPKLPPWWGEPIRVEEWNETWVLREPA